MRHEMGDDFGISFTAEMRALLLQLVAQLAEVLDDAVMDHSQAFGGVRMCIALAGTTVGGPAGVADAACARERFPRKALLEIAELTLGTAARELAAFQRRNAGRVVAAILEPFECIDELFRDRLTAQDADNPAHCYMLPGCIAAPKPCFR